MKELPRDYMSKETREESTDEVFRHKNTHSPHNFRGKPGTTFSYHDPYSIVCNHTIKKEKENHPRAKV